MVSGDGAAVRRARRREARRRARGVRPGPSSGCGRSTPARRPVASPTRCSSTVRRRSWRSTSGTASCTNGCVRDARVEVLERTNLRHVDPGELGPFDAVVADLSFISLTKVMSVLVGCCRARRLAGAARQAAVRGGPPRGQPWSWRDHRPGGVGRRGRTGRAQRRGARAASVAGLACLAAARRRRQRRVPAAPAPSRGPAAAPGRRRGARPGRRVPWSTRAWTPCRRCDRRGPRWRRMSVVGLVMHRERAPELALATVEWLLERGHEVRLGADEADPAPAARAGCRRDRTCRSVST